MILKLIEKFKKFKNFLGRRVWWLFITSTLTGVVLFIVEFSFVVIMPGFLLAIGLIDETQAMLPSWYPRRLSIAVLMFLLFACSRAFIFMVKTYVSQASQFAFEAHQRSKILELGLLNLDSLSSHELIATYNEKVNKAATFLMMMSIFIIMLVSSVLLFFSGLKLAPLETIIGVLFLAVMMIPLKALDKLLTKAGSATSNDTVKVNKIFLQGIKYNFYLKIYGLLEKEIEEGKNLLNKIQKNFLKAYQFVAFKGNFPNIIGAILVCFITYFSIKVLHTKAVVLISFFYIFLRLAQNVSSLVESYSNLRVYLPFVKEVYWFNESLKEKINDEEKSKITLNQKPLKNENDIVIEFKNVFFSYDKKNYVLKDISFKVQKGELFLIKGESGSGKSTLLSLALGFLRPTSGEILINGENIMLVQKSLYKKIGYVGPEPYIIEGTIRDNLLFGHVDPKNVSDEEMLRALEIAQLSSNERFRLDYFIHEQTPLSTGQKQRLSLARALVRKPSLLVLDEATANLDPVTENNFIEALKPILSSTTSLVVSHKSSFDSIATKTLTLN
jgi:ATP-binding cassette subfamily C protein